MRWGVAGISPRCRAFRQDSRKRLRACWRAGMTDHARFETRCRGVASVVGCGTISALRFGLPASATWRSGCWPGAAWAAHLPPSLHIWARPGVGRRRAGALLVCCAARAAGAPAPRRQCARSPRTPARRRENAARRPAAGEAAQPFRPARRAALASRGGWHKRAAVPGARA